MAKEQRHKIIKELEEARGNTLLISYVTSTRSNLEVQIEIDSVRKIYEHLIVNKAQKKNTKIDLFINSNGGNGIVPWRLITLLREYCKHITVLIPHRAFSAATLLALGADEILMHPMGMLGPVDPTVTNPFNPTDTRTNQTLGISVEDVSSYITLIKDDVGIRHEDELIQAFNLLASKVHPLALGNVKRFMVQSRMMAKKLLELHMSKASDEHKIGEIVENLTSKLYYHGHPINRQEACDLGLKIGKIDEKVEDIMWRLYCEYENEMLLDAPFRPVDDFVQANPSLAANATASLRLSPCKGVFIESLGRTDVFSIDFEVFGQRLANLSYQTNISTLKQGWGTE
ncbi:MAG: hypothetical protein HZB33_09005 [Nitrospirae bacterium]|nr:hypothetical protein [Nitrospirota bacterium]